MRHSLRALALAAIVLSTAHCATNDADNPPDDAATPDAAQPDATMEPDTTGPDATEPDTTEPDATGPDATEPDATEPDATEPDAVADATEPDAVADATEPDAVADATEPDATEPDAVADATGPDATEPDADIGQVEDVPCVASCEDKVCGDDGCGGSCGGCALFESCDAAGQCASALTCIEATNAIVGSCTSPETCMCVGCVTNGVCDPTEDDCVCPDCDEGALCSNPDVCIDDGLCDPYNEGCVCADCSGHPLCDCAPSCEGKICGDDGCLGSCGGCDSGLVCSDDQTACVSCEPSCEGVSCGDDGCGGSCGVCTDGQGCAPSGACEASALGASCANPKTIDTLPYTDTDDSTLHGDHNHDFGACAEWADGTGQHVSDVAYAFTPSASGSYVLSIAPAPAAEPPVEGTEESGFASAFFPSVMQVSTSCGWPVGAASTDAMCHGYSGDLWGGGDGGAWEVALDADTTYIIVLDGLIPGFDEGPYTFTLDAACMPACDGKACGDDGCGGTCGACATSEICDDQGSCVTPDAQPGDGCDDPYLVDGADGLPWSTSGDTAAATDTQSHGYMQCPGTTDSAGSDNRDHVYAFTAADSGVYTVTLDADFAATLYALESCGDSGSCLGGADATDGLGAEWIHLWLDAGETAYLVVDGAGFSDASGTYELSISEPCQPSCDGKACGDDGCGGDCGACPDGSVCDGAGTCIDASTTVGNTCTNPHLIDALPYEGTGDTSADGATDNYAGLLGYCPGIYEDTGDGAADHAYSFTPASDGAYSVWLDSDHDAALYVATDCADVATTCVVGDDGLETDALVLSATADTPYFIIVDGYQGATGAYTLNVSACAPSCEGKDCGSDGCGGTCGECTGDDSCSDDGQCTPPSCAGFCGDQSPAGCYCDDTCFDFGDCCADICETCVEQFPGDPADCAL